MNDYDVPTGLSMLADEAEPAPIDSREIISKARTRTRNRRASAATAFGTVAAVGALAVTLGFPNADKDGTGVGGPPSTSPDCANGVCELPVPPAPSQEQADEFDTQLAAAIDNLIPAGFTLERDPESTEEPLKFVGTDHGDGPVYTANGWLRDAQGPASITVYVLKKAAGTSLAHATGQFFGPCHQGEPNCEIRTLDDGTQATAQANQRPPGLQLSSTLSAQRPDGTYIQVITSIGIGAVPGDEQARPEPPMTNADLFKWATVFTWSESGAAGTGTAKYDDQLAAAGGLPSRYTLEGAGNNTNPKTFQEAPDGSSTPKYVLQLNLEKAGGERSTFSLFISPKAEKGAHPGRCADGAKGCKEHNLEDGTLASVQLTDEDGGETARLSALRPDGTVIEVDNLGDVGADLLTNIELLKFAVAFNY